MEFLLLVARLGRAGVNQGAMQWNRHDEPLLSRLRARMRLRPSPVIPLVGAGLSVRAGLPLFGRFVTRLLDHAAELNRDRGSLQAGLIALEDGELPRAVKHARTALGDAKYVELVRVLLTPSPDADLTLQSLLAEWAPPVIVTTNLDETIEAAFERIGRRYFVWADGRTPRPEGEGTLIVKIHGTLSAPETWVLTEDEYHRRLFVQPDEFGALWREVRASDLLVVGYGLADRDLVQPLEWMSWREWTREESVFVLLADDAGETLRRRLQQVNAWLVEYAHDHDHAELDDALRGLLGLPLRRRALADRVQAARQTLGRLVDPRELAPPGVVLTAPPGLLAWLAGGVPGPALARLHGEVRTLEARAAALAPGGLETIHLGDRPGATETLVHLLEPEPEDATAPPFLLEAAVELAETRPRLARLLAQDALRLAVAHSGVDLAPYVEAVGRGLGGRDADVFAVRQALSAARFLVLSPARARDALALGRRALASAGARRESALAAAIILYARLLLLDEPGTLVAETDALSTSLAGDDGGDVQVLLARVFVGLARLRAVPRLGADLPPAPDAVFADAAAVGAHRDHAPEDAALLPEVQLAWAEAALEQGEHDAAVAALEAATASWSDLSARADLASSARDGLARAARARAILATYAGDVPLAVATTRAALASGALSRTVASSLRVCLGRALAQMRRFEEASAVLAEATAALPAEVDPGLALALAAERAALAAILDVPATTRSPFSDVEHAAQRAGLPDVALRAVVATAAWLVEAGRVTDARTTLSRAEAALARPRHGRSAMADRALHVEARIVEARISLALGAPLDAWQTISDTEGEAALLATSRPRLYGEYLRVRGRIARERGQFPEAVALFSRALLHAARSKDVTRVVYAHVALAELSRGLGDAVTALAHAEAARARFADLESLDPEGARAEPTRLLAADISLTRALALQVADLAAEAQQQAEAALDALPRRADGSEAGVAWLARAGKAQMVIGLALCAQARVAPADLRWRLVGEGADALWRAISRCADGREHLDAALCLRLYVDLQLAYRDADADHRAAQAIAAARSWPPVAQNRPGEALYHWLRALEKTTALVEAVGREHALEVMGPKRERPARLKARLARCVRAIGWDPDDRRGSVGTS